MVMSDWQDSVPPASVPAHPHAAPSLEWNTPGAVARAEASALTREALVLIARHTSPGDGSGPAALRSAPADLFQAARLRASDSDGEQQMAAMFAALDPTWRVLHDVPAADQDAATPRVVSHLLLSPHGLFPVRVRRRPGAAVTVAGDEVLIDGTPTDDVAILRRDAATVSERLHAATGLRVIPRPLLVFTGHDSLAALSDPHDVHVLSAPTLVSTLSEARDLAIFVGHQGLDEDLVSLLWAACLDPTTWNPTPTVHVPAPRVHPACESTPTIIDPGAVPLAQVDAHMRALREAAKNTPGPARTATSAHAALPSRVISITPGALARGAVTQQRAHTPQAPRQVWENDQGEVLPVPVRPRILRGQANPTHVSDMGVFSRLGVGLIGVGVAAVTSMAISAPTSAAAYEPTRDQVSHSVQQSGGVLHDISGADPSQRSGR